MASLMANPIDCTLIALKLYSQGSKLCLFHLKAETSASKC